MRSARVLRACVHVCVQLPGSFLRTCAHVGGCKGGYTAVRIACPLCVCVCVLCVLCVLCVCVLCVCVVCVVCAVCVGGEGVLSAAFTSVPCVIGILARHHARTAAVQGPPPPCALGCLHAVAQGGAKHGLGKRLFTSGACYQGNYEEVRQRGLSPRGMG